MFEHALVGNPEERFCRVEAHLFNFFTGVQGAMIQEVIEAVEIQEGTSMVVIMTIEAEKDTAHEGTQVLQDLKE